MIKLYEKSIMKYLGYVYNLEVDDKHSYIAEGIAVHNCYNPATDTITFSSPKYIREEVVLHELLHYVVDLKLGNLSPIHPLGVPDRIDLKTLVVTSAVSAAIGAVVWAVMDRYVLKKVLK